MLCRALPVEGSAETAKLLQYHTGALPESPSQPVPRGLCTDSFCQHTEVTKAMLSRVKQRTWGRSDGGREAVQVRRRRRCLERLNVSRICDI